MSLYELKLYWIEKINETLAKWNIVVKETSKMHVYDVSKERGMNKKLWLCANCNDGKDRYFYAFITKRNELKLYNGSVYANVKSDYDEDISNPDNNYKYLKTVD